MHAPQPMPPALLEEITQSTEEKARLVALKEPKLSKRKRDAREQRENEKADAAKRARLAEQEARQPLGRGQRRSATVSPPDALAMQPAQ